MDKLLSYNDLKLKKQSLIFEHEEIKDLSTSQINEAEDVYKRILESIESGEDLDEGFMSGLIGGGIGAIAGPAVGRAICKALGINENGTLGKLLTSRLVTTAIGVALGK